MRRRRSAVRPFTRALAPLAATTLAGSLVVFSGSLPAGAAPSPPISTTTTTAPALNRRGEPPPPAVPQPFGRLTCVPHDGVRFCAGGETADRDRRVPSFDGVPLDVDVTLPTTGRGPFPLIVLLHGLGGTKTSYESVADDGQIDNVTLASQGFAVVTYTARGFGESCGTTASRTDTPGCAKGWTHLADQRYEVRDTEYLAGLLVDEGLVLPTFGVAGVSYGAGQALELAMLHDRIRLPGGQFAPLVSPRHRIPMTVGAVFAMWPWDDLVSSLAPNGNPNGAMAYATNAASAAADTAPDRQPVGLPKASWLTDLFGTITAEGYIPAPGVDPQDDLAVWYHQMLSAQLASRRLLAGLQTLAVYHSAAGIPPSSSGPAATAVQSGWGDSLFPVSQALEFNVQFGNALTSPAAPLLQIFDDVGHPWAQNKAADGATDNRLVQTFFQAILNSKGTAPTGTIAIGQTCPKSAPSGPVLPGRSLSDLAQSSVSITGGPSQVVTSTGGRATESSLNPVGGAPLCLARANRDAPGIATYTQAVGTQSTLMLGSVQVTATVTVRGTEPQLIGELWDVAPDGSAQIVALGPFRPPVSQAPNAPAGSGSTEQVSFSLDPAEYTFAAGHTIELQLVGSDAPTFLAPTGRFSIRVSGLQVSVPTAVVPTVTPLTF